LNDRTLFHHLPAQERADIATTQLLIVLFGRADHNDALAGIDSILQYTGGLTGLVNATREQLESISNIHPSMINQVAALVEVMRRLQARAPSERPIIRSAQDAAEVVDDMRNLDQEHVRVILLDSRDKVMDIVTVYMGTLNTSLIRTTEIFREAILRNSAGIILAHNHPSGNPQPSPEDVQMSRGLSAAGRLLDIPLRDHLIIGRDGWVSLKELGLM